MRSGGGDAPAEHPSRDLDVWIEASPANAVRVLSALRQFGAPLGDLTEADLEKPGTGFKMGIPPRRIDLLTEISGVSFDDAWPRRTEASFGPDVRSHVIGSGGRPSFLVPAVFGDAPSRNVA